MKASSTTQKLLPLAAAKAIIDERLKTYFREQAALAEAIDPLFVQLIHEMDQFIARGGKRLRPYLVYLSYVGFGGEDIESIWPIATSQEVMHNFALIHDDLMDRDTFRYGGPNISGRYQTILGPWAKAEAEHLSNGMAILAGDLNQAFAYDLVASSALDASIVAKIVGRLKRMMFEAAGGQQLDVLMPWLPDNQVTVNRLQAVSHYKTGSYSFETPLQIGAIAAGVSASHLDNIAVASRPLGLAFQLHDDLLGMFGNEAETGKPAISDLREGKRTLLIQFGLEMATPAAAKRLRGYLGNPKVNVSHLDDARDILTCCGAKARLEDQAKQAGAEAKQALSGVGWSPEVTAELEGIAEFVTTRRA